MKTKTLLKVFIAFLALVAAASCITPIDPAFERSEAEELSQLKEYIDTLQHRGLDVDTTDLGVYYVVDIPGEGPFPATGDSCILKYEGFLLSSGYVFDASSIHNSNDSTYTYIMGNNQVITGWADGMHVINKGARVYLIIPSSLAYGATGNNYTIGPYETLIFKVDMVDIK